MPAPYGEGNYAVEPPLGSGVNITDLFHIVQPKPEDPGIFSKIDSQYPNVAIITFDTPNQFGGMWAKEQLDLTMPFSTEMYLHLGRSYGYPNTLLADGMTFTLQNDSGGINAIGGAGEGLGVYRGRKWTGDESDPGEHGTYLRNSLIIEFDTFENSRSTGLVVFDPIGGPHCSLIIPRAETINEVDHLNTFHFQPLQDWVKFEVIWTPHQANGGTLDYTFNGVSNTYVVNDVLAMFGGTKVNWGFTGATGQLTSVHAAAITRLPFQGIIAEKTVTNAAGENIDHGTAKPGDILTYSIKVTAQSVSSSIGPIIIDDYISEYIDYVPGPFMVLTSGGAEYAEMSTFSASLMVANTRHTLYAEGEWVKITFNATVMPNTAGKVVYNSAEIIAIGLTDIVVTNTTEVSLLADPVKEVSDTSEAGIGGKAVKVGDSITYEIQYSNDETDAATIIIIDSLPDGVDYSLSSDGGLYNADNHTVTWTLDNVAAGTSGLVTVTAIVNNSALVKISNIASVQVGDNEPIITNIVENPVTPSKSVSDISEAGTEGSPVKVDDRITYEIYYSNDGPDTETIIIVDSLPAEVDYLLSSNGGLYNAGANTVTWTLDDVASGAFGSVTVTVVVSSRAVIMISNVASVQVGDDDPVTTNIVENPVDPLAPTKRVSDNSEAGRDGGSVKVGDRITYEINYRNNSAANANITITDMLPVGVDFLSAEGGGLYNEAARTITWSFTNVPSAAGGTVSFIVVVNNKAMKRIINYATVQVGADSPQETNLVINPLKGSYCDNIRKPTKCRAIIRGNKTWIDNNNITNSRPPSIEITLSRDGELYKSISIDSSGDGAYAFTCLPIWKNSEHKYMYRVDEAEIPEGYIKTINGYNIINTLVN